MPGTTLFISDLHLCGARPAITGLFLDFLRGRARTSDALYILGDLFEYWIGDEAVEQEEFRSIIRGLHELTASGTPVFMMHGNRDFLMDDGFEKATGGHLLKDPALIDLYGTPTLLMHGDSLCTDET
jgi:UDP-2,3-diacylglucosamine hydrolase